MSKAVSSEERQRYIPNSPSLLFDRKNKPVHEVRSFGSVPASKSVACPRHAAMSTSVVINVVPKEPTTHDERVEFWQGVLDVEYLLVDREDSLLDIECELRLVDKILGS